MDPAPINMIETIVTLKPKDTWRPGVTKNDIELAMMEKLSKLPGLNLAFTQPIAGRLSMLTTGVRTDLGLKLYGEDLKVLQEKAFEIEKLMSGIPGVSDLLAERIFGAPYLEVSADREKIARYGLNVNDVEDAVELAIGGRTATTTIEGKRRFEVLLRYNRDSREKINAMQNILVPIVSIGAPSAGGAGMGGGMGGSSAAASGPPPAGYVPLGNVAQFRVVDGASMISSENGVYRVVVQMNTRGRDVVSFVDEASKLIKDKVQLPPGYYFKWTGQYENQQRAKERLSVVIPAVILLTFFLLFLAFHSASDALLILLNVPFALIGGIVAIYLAGMYLTVAAGGRIHRFDGNRRAERRYHDHLY